MLIEKLTFYNKGKNRKSYRGDTRWPVIEYLDIIVIYESFPLFQFGFKQSVRKILEGKDYADENSPKVFEIHGNSRINISNVAYNLTC